MAWQPTHLTAQQLEERRREAAHLLRSGTCSQAQVARALGVSEASVSRWAASLRRSGVRALRVRPRTGRPPKLSEEGWREVCRVLKRGARALGYRNERWTLSRVAQLIEERFHVHYHPHYLAEPLRAHGLTPQVPKRRALERDEALIRAWLAQDWPRIKRGLDEAAGRSPS
jgi:transposase